MTFPRKVELIVLNLYQLIASPIRADLFVLLLYVISCVGLHVSMHKTTKKIVNMSKDGFMLFMKNKPSKRISKFFLVHWFGATVTATCLIEFRLLSKALWETSTENESGPNLRFFQPSKNEYFINAQILFRFVFIISPAVCIRMSTNLNTILVEPFRFVALLSACQVFALASYS